MWQIRRPTETCLRDFLDRQVSAELSYQSVGATGGDAWPQGYDHDHHRACLGHGTQVFEAACEALRQWRHFPRPWTRIFAPDASIVVGTTIAMVAYVYGQWWING